MAINTLLVKSYAQNVYITGMNSLGNIAIVRPEYVPSVMKRAAEAYYIDDIDYALTKSWITPIEHADTLALKQPDDPQNRPPITYMATEEIL